MVGSGILNVASRELRLSPIRRVSRGALMYWEVQLDDLLNNVSAHYEQKTLYVPFVPKPLEVTIDYSILEPLLKQVKKVWNTNTPPERRDECDDCKKLDLLFAIEQEVESQDTKMLNDFSTFQNERDQITRRVRRRLAYRRSALEELAKAGEAMFAVDGVAANWEFHPLDDSI